MSKPPEHGASEPPHQGAAVKASRRRFASVTTYRKGTGADADELFEGLRLARQAAQRQEGYDEVRASKAARFLSGLQALRRLAGEPPSELDLDTRDPRVWLVVRDGLSDIPRLRVLAEAASTDWGGVREPAIRELVAIRDLEDVTVGDEDRRERLSLALAKLVPVVEALHGFGSARGPADSRPKPPRPPKTTDARVSVIGKPGQGGARLRAGDRDLGPVKPPQIELLIGLGNALDATVVLGRTEAHRKRAGRFVKLLQAAGVVAKASRRGNDWIVTSDSSLVVEIVEKTTDRVERARAMRRLVDVAVKEHKTRLR